MSRQAEARNMVDQFFFGKQSRPASTPFRRIFRVRPVLLALSIIMMSALMGCSSDDCVNCVQLPPPVVPTGVHSISGDNLVIVQWYDISYSPYDGQYNANVTAYYIYSRYYNEGDENIPDRQFGYIGEVAWDENFDGSSGLHYFYDYDAVNGERYEYAVAAVNSNGQESALSYEFVTDAPLPMSLSPVEIFDVNAFPQYAGFDFSALDFGRVDPTQPGTTADIQVVFQGLVPYVQTVRSGVHLQDFGVFLDSEGSLYFEGVSWAPLDGYSYTGTSELILGHIYVVEIDNGSSGTHYAKFGVVGINNASVNIIWAFQTIDGLQELSVPEKPEVNEVKPVTISF